MNITIVLNNSLIECCPNTNVGFLLTFVQEENFNKPAKYSRFLDDQDFPWNWKLQTFSFKSSLCVCVSLGVSLPSLSETAIPQVKCQRHLVERGMLYQSQEGIIRLDFHGVHSLGSWILNQNLNPSIHPSTLPSFLPFYLGKSGNGSAEINSELSINGSQFALKTLSFHLSKWSLASLMHFFCEAHEITKMLEEDTCLGWPMNHHQYVAPLMQRMNVIATL